VGRYEGGDPLEISSYSNDQDALVPNENTLFDLASLTKPLATALLVLRLVDEGRFSLGEELGAVLDRRRAVEGPPTAATEETASLTLRRLLTHTGGLPAVPGLMHVVSPRRGDYAHGGGLPSRAEVARARSALYGIRARPELDDQVLYSCTGFLFLGEAVAAVTGTPLSAAFRRLVSAGAHAPASSAAQQSRAVPARAFSLGYLPPETARHRCAPTEEDPWRGRRIQGEVHDENAYALGGAAGNAGLFGTLDAVHEHILRIWGGLVGVANSRLSASATPLLSPETAALTVQEHVAAPLAAPLAGRQAGALERRGLGVQLVPREVAAETGLSQKAFGHTGFTGTSFEVDPERSLVMIALTNRVFYGREGTEESIRRFRHAFHRRSVEAFG
jgi:CubicO group peptidase (beta-lactamase class C family)